MRKNIRVIPASILRKCEGIGGLIVAACAKRMTVSEANLLFERLGVSIDSVRAGVDILPPKNAGKYSLRNINGYEKIFKDLPKIPREFSLEAPDWGGLGTHTVWYERMCYQRRVIAPRGQLMRMKIKAESQSNLEIAIRLSEPMDKEASDFKDLLFESLNILQENIGCFGVEPSDKSMSDYRATLHVDWTIFPHGKTMREIVGEILRSPRFVNNEEVKRIAQERGAFFDSLKVECFVKGHDSFDNYIGAKIRDDLVVFDSLRYGNAVYILRADWQELSRKSRIELLSGKYGDGFYRILHKKGWANRARELIDHLL